MKQHWCERQVLLIVRWSGSCCNPGTWKAEEQDCPWLHNKLEAILGNVRLGFSPSPEKKMLSERRRDQSEVSATQYEAVHHLH